MALPSLLIQFRDYLLNCKFAGRTQSKSMCLLIIVFVANLAGVRRTIIFSPPNPPNERNPFRRRRRHQVYKINVQCGSRPFLFLLFGSR